MTTEPAGRATLNPIDAPGTPEAEWRAWPELSALPSLAYGGWHSVVVIAAHPDDEVLGVGGLLSLLAAVGVRLRLVAVTDGEASHPGIAIDCFASQLEPRDAGLDAVLPPGILAHFTRDQEVLFR